MLHRRRNRHPHRQDVVSQRISEELESWQGRRGRTGASLVRGDDG